jgi:hypothetical protein
MNFLEEKINDSSNFTKYIQKTLIDPPIQNSLYAFQSKPSIWDINIDHESDKSTFLNIFSEIT